MDIYAKPSNPAIRPREGAAVNTDQWLVRSTIYEAWNRALKRLESEKLAEKLARDSLAINSSSDQDDGTVARESSKTHVEIRQALRARSDSHWYPSKKATTLALSTIKSNEIINLTLKLVKWLEWSTN